MNVPSCILNIYIVDTSVDESKSWSTNKVNYMYFKAQEVNNNNYCPEALALHYEVVCGLVLSLILNNVTRTHSKAILYCSCDAQ